MVLSLSRIVWHGLVIVACLAVVTGGSLAVVTSHTGVSANNVDEFSPQSQQQQLEIKYSDSATVSSGKVADGSRTSESLVITVTEGSVTLGPETNSRLRVRDISTGEILTLEPSANAEKTINIEDEILVIDPGIGEDDPPATVSQGFDKEIDVTASGETDIFKQQKFGPFKVQVIDQNGGVRAQTDPAPHGIFRPDVTGEVNDTAVAIERPSDYNASFNVRFYSSFDALVEENSTELTNQQGAAFFRGEVEGQNLDDPIVRVFPSETSPDGQRIAAVDFSLDRIEGSVGSTENKTSDPAEMPETPKNETDTPEDGSNSDTNNTTTNVTVQLDSAPDGLRQFRVSVEGPSESSITTVTPGVLTGNAFEIVSGGEGNSTVTAQAVDLPLGGEEVTESTDPVKLYEVTFAESVNRSELQVEADTLTNDNDTAINESRLSVEVEIDAPQDAPQNTTNPFSAPVPGADGQGPPTDTDDDGKLEDVNGDAESTFEDVVALAFVISQTGQLTEQQRDALNIDGEGDVDFDDVIALAFDI